MKTVRGPEQKEKAPEITAVPAKGSMRPARILVCEDNAVNRTLAERILGKAGYRTGSACSGEEAVSLFRQEEWDLVLMDVQMPGMDGVRATTEIRAQGARGHTIPVVAMTAHASQKDRERCLLAGMDGYLTKPFSPEDLLQAVQLHLGGPPEGAFPHVSNSETKH